ncbi:MAG: VOC family protein [Acidobacteria bacterium]|nr:VOC family protein [Acidobacteriota bacterium]
MASERKQYPLAVMLTCRDMRRSVVFYKDTLGFTMQEAWPDRDNPMWANMVLDEQSVMLGALMTPGSVDEACDSDVETAAYMKELVSEAERNQVGAGVQVYVQVPDVDALHGRVKSKNPAGLTSPKTQFYGQRDFAVKDPDGYRLVFYTLVKLNECQSCGMPLTDAKPGQLYCQYCTDSHGALKPYEQVFEGTVTGYFIGMLQMSRPEAEKAAREHLAKMPAWMGRV